MNEPTCIVTGAAGFIGSHLVERLLSLRYKVIGIDNFSSGNILNLSSALKSECFRLITADICDSNLFTNIKLDNSNNIVIFHLAAIVSVPFSIDHPEKTFSVNYAATLSLLKQSTRLGAKSFVFAGSASEYGPCSGIPLKESDAVNNSQSSPYGITKFLSTQAVAQHPCGVSLRFFNVYGSRQDPTSQYSGVVSRFLHLAQNKQSLTIFGDGEQTRDFIHVKDVVESYLYAGGILTNLPLHGVFNVGTGSGVTINTLAKVICKIYSNPSKTLYFPDRNGDIRNSIADISRIISATRWRPSVSIYQGLLTLTDNAKTMGPSGFHVVGPCHALTG